MIIVTVFHITLSIKHNYVFFSCLWGLLNPFLFSLITCIKNNNSRIKSSCNIRRMGSRELGIFNRTQGITQVLRYKFLPRILVIVGGTQELESGLKNTGGHDKNNVKKEETDCV